jgi:hypothetical protein
VEGAIDGFQRLAHRFDGRLGKLIAVPLRKRAFQPSTLFAAYFGQIDALAPGFCVDIEDDLRTLLFVENRISGEAAVFLLELVRAFDGLLLAQGGFDVGFLLVALGVDFVFCRFSRIGREFVVQGCDTLFSVSLNLQAGDSDLARLSRLADRAGFFGDGGKLAFVLGPPCGHSVGCIFGCL